MRILFVVKNMRLSNGVSSFVMNYYRQICGKEFQFDFLVISDVGSPYYEEIKQNGSKLFLMPSYKKEPLKIIPYVYNVLRENQYDIVHCNVFNSGSLILFIARCVGVPLRILHSHATQTGDSKLKQIRNKMFCSISLFFANTYFSCSHLAGDYIYGKDNYYLIPNAVDINKYSFSMDMREKLRSSDLEKKYVLMTVGRFTKQKNPFFIVDVISDLKCNGCNFIFWWFGNGEMEDAVKNYAKEKSVFDDIVFWGASDKVSEYYSAADAFLLPSIYEGLPVVGVEAQVSGLPVFFSSKITKEAKISDNVYFLPIESSAEWSRTIIEIMEKYDVGRRELVSFDEYRIENQSIKLRNLYIKLLKEQRENKNV